MNRIPIVDVAESVDEMDRKAMMRTMSGGPSSREGDLFARGQRVDRYEIREPIGQGGMGTVYRAIDTRLGRTVALKTVIPHRLAGDIGEEVRQRFLREALAASKVDHRNVVQIMDFGFAGEGVPYIVMEYLRGRDLGAVLKQAPEPLQVEYVADVILGVCAALRACHQVGIVHRDLKPANIFLVDTDTGYEVKVLDFGVSKAPVADELTEDGQILGTPQYLSPEQVDGKTVPETDQYAVGILLYVCLTKRLPYEDHQNLSLLRAIELGRFLPPRAHRPDLPEGLEALILRAMRAAPSERFESVHGLGQRLWEFASPRGRDQWKNFYFHTPPFARQLDQSTRSVPLVEELARGKAKSGPHPQMAPRAVAPTQVMPPSTPPGVPPATGTELLPAAESVPQAAGGTELLHPSERIDGPPEHTEPDLGSQRSVSTKLERREPAPEEEDADEEPAETFSPPPPSRSWRTPLLMLFFFSLSAASVAGIRYKVKTDVTNAFEKHPIPTPAPPASPGTSPHQGRPTPRSPGPGGVRTPPPAAPPEVNTRPGKDAGEQKIKRPTRNRPKRVVEYDENSVPIMP